MKANLVFFGSPQIASDLLECLVKSGQVSVVGVVTTPDRPTGRSLTLTPSPVALLAQEYNLPLFKPQKLDQTNLAHLKLFKPDLFLVVSYGKIIPKDYLETPPLGTFNIHFSLLPRYRGALCVSEAIKNEDPETGVTLMEMDEQLDHGPIIAQTKVPIDISDDTATLTTKLTQSACSLLDNKIPEISAQNYQKQAQDDSLAIFTPSHKTHTRPNAFIPFEKILLAQTGIGSSALHALIRSQNPDPGAWTTVNEIDLKLIKTSLTDDRKLSLDLVQLPGKSPITWKQFLSGHPVKNQS